ncbi:hypothetical protein GCM10009679_54190 [Saccharothrix algeriensis]|uniref:Uncharacterized protein n=1 Tax=Catellatospora bangladeshensis TaxID=310355 RepID=A0A8J3NMB7_9ACTN|nr:hypothetical protein Cba03nite_64100 [Catellatospora bangladeshensis]
MTSVTVMPTEPFSIRMIFDRDQSRESATWFWVRSEESRADRRAFRRRSRATAGFVLGLT